MTRRFASLFSSLSVATLVLLASCGGPSGRLMSEDEDDLVGSDRAGSAVYDRLVQGTVADLLQKYEEQVLRGEAPTQIDVVFVGIKNSSREELADWRRELEQVVDTAINEYRGFRTISRLTLDAVLRDTGLTANDLLLPRNRRKFLEALEATGTPARVMVFGELTSGGQRSGDTSQLRYRFTFDAIDTVTNANIKADSAQRKEYTR